MADENSLLHFLKTLIALRKSSPALSAEGDVTFLNRENRGYPLAYRRTGGGETYDILINPTGKEAAYRLEGTGEIACRTGEVCCAEGLWRLGPVSAVILRK